MCVYLHFVVFVLTKNNVGIDWIKKNIDVFMLNITNWLSEEENEKKGM